MSPSLQELADKLGIRLPNSSPKPSRPSRRSKRAARKAAPAKRRYKGETCSRGHVYGDHTKITRKNGKEYRTRYCRECYTLNERKRRERARATRDD